MKLLGEFPSRIASIYKDILLDQGIEVKVAFPDNPDSSYNLSHSIANRNGGIESSEVGHSSVYVQDESYDKAVGIIDDYEMKQRNKIKERDEKFNSLYLKFLIAVGVIVLVIFLITFIKK
jgi:hypothetical protein